MYRAQNFTKIGSLSFLLSFFSVSQSMSVVRGPAGRRDSVSVPPSLSLPHDFRRDLLNPGENWTAADTPACFLFNTTGQFSFLAHLSGLRQPARLMLSLPSAVSMYS